MAINTTRKTNAEAMFEDFDSDTPQNRSLNSLVQDLNSLIQAVNAASGSSRISDAQFRTSFNRAVEILGAEESEVRDMIGITKPTFQRWQSGDSAPAPLMRPIVLETLRKEAQRKLSIAGPSL